MPSRVAARSALGGLHLVNERGVLLAKLGQEDAALRPLLFAGIAGAGTSPCSTTMAAMRRCARPRDAEGR